MKGTSPTRSVVRRASTTFANLRCWQPVRTNTGLGVISRNCIVAPAAELKYAEPVSKRIAERSLLAPAEGLKFPLELRSSRHGTLNHSGDIPNFKVEMHRRPVSTVVAN